MQKGKIAIASDHAGYQMKEFLIGYLGAMGWDVHDFGAHSEQSVDYPDFAHPLGFAVENGEFPLGISLCGSGNGISMALNKHRGIRSAICWEPELATLAREHNDANVCSLPARFITNDVAVQIVENFLNTEFAGGRHQHRVDMIPVEAWEKSRQQ